MIHFAWQEEGDGLKHERTYVCDNPDCRKTVTQRGKKQNAKPEGWITVLLINDEKHTKRTWGFATWCTGEVCSEACCVVVLRRMADQMEKFLADGATAGDASSSVTKGA